MAKAKAIMLHVVTIILACALSSGLTLWLVNSDREKASVNARPTSEQEIIESMYGFYKAYDVLEFATGNQQSNEVAKKFIGTNIYVGKSAFDVSYWDYELQSRSHGKVKRVRRPIYELTKVDEAFFDANEALLLPIDKSSLKKACYLLAPKERAFRDETLQEYFLQVDNEFYYINSSFEVFLKLERITYQES